MSEVNPNPAAPSPVAPAPAVGAPKKKSGVGKVVLMLVGAFVGLAIVIFAIVFFFTKGASDAAEKIVANLQATTCEVIYTDQVTSDFQSIVLKEEWLTECARIGSVLTGVPDQVGVSVDGQSGQASTSQVSYAIEGTDGLVYDLVISMVKVDGEWKMDRLDSTSR